MYLDIVVDGVNISWIGATAVLGVAPYCNEIVPGHQRRYEIRLEGEYVGIKGIRYYAQNI
ncbi:hypothetical protein K432DRAFT_387098 [Lepidopterella palustris CBS 459.81]|uniref:Uncharacterized protein n=1 Tax=Lepidopterella palustris CBS 459.81 TaxID=1314670 RepID=A0A8E2J959_9PEZI|nr:hypothetical protein K432DRAFT_387098 [Lepidopterella palustris CBS 459.81]